jgi:hypothetical protein
MNFFGLTYLGAGAGSNLIKALNVTSFSDKEFEQAFDQTDKTNKGFIETHEFRILFSRVYGGEPPEYEITFLLDGFKNVTDPRITKEMFMEGIAALREAATERDPNSATEFKSNQDLKDAMHKHARVQYNPQEKFRTPELTSHEYGWYAQTKVEQTERKPKKNCDETVYAAEMIKTGIYF